MHFKSLMKSSFPILALLLSSVGCVKPLSDLEGENLIGEKISNISSIQRQKGDEKSKVAIFDETTRKIHQFDLETMKYQRSHSVQNPGDLHSIMFNDIGNYTIDISKNNVSVFDSQGNAQYNVMKLLGTPASAAYRWDLNLVVIYDDLSNVGILKLTPSGQVETSQVLGPIVDNNANISSGDLNDDGKLILALSDDSIAVIDIAATLSARKWIFTKYASGLSRISWLAPLPDSSNLIFVKSDDKLSVLDINLQTTTNSLDIKDLFVEKYSKTLDPHILLRENPLDYENSSNTVLAYYENGQIKTRPMVRKQGLYMSSVLDLKRDLWTFVDGDLKTQYWWNELNYIKTGRRVKSYRFSDLLAIADKDLPDRTKVQISGDFVFSLYPSELGYATRYSLSKSETKESKLFNIPHIKP